MTDFNISMSSADPEELMRYEKLSDGLNRRLDYEARQLSAALRTFASTCTEYSTGIGPQLADDLQKYVQRIDLVDQWVGQVRLGFQYTDQPGDVGLSFEETSALGVPYKGQRGAVGSALAFANAAELAKGIDAAYGISSQEPGSKSPPGSTTNPDSQPPYPFHSPFSTHRRLLAEPWLAGDNRAELEMRAKILARNNTGMNHGIGIQSLYDPAVYGKELRFDGFSVKVRLPPGATPQEYLEGMATDMDAFLQGPITDRADFERWGGSHPPIVGQVTYIDLKLWGSSTLQQYDAPVVLCEYDRNSHFTVQTIELDGQEHPLHGVRQWGFDQLPDGQVRFYTMGVTRADILIAGIDPLGKNGESDMWRSWLDSIEQKVKRDGGEVQTNSRTAWQKDFRPEELAGSR